MLQLFSPQRVPRYHGHEWLPSGLPLRSHHWQVKDSVQKKLGKTLRKATRHQSWRWPEKPLYFVSDAHADAEAFAASLVASGGVERTGFHHREFRLTSAGQQGRFIIGGDCLDKGPSNLELLDTIKHLRDQGADIKLLAGNHDMRLLMGLKSITGQRTLLTEHLFVRMGPKVIPLLAEVYQRYLHDSDWSLPTPHEDYCRQQLFPTDKWFAEFPQLASTYMTAPAIEKEVRRMADKSASFEQRCEKAGMDIRAVWATAHKCRELFLEPDGDYYWFFAEMDLLHREGSFLFLHAGLDDSVATQLHDEGIQALNQEFKAQLDIDLFGFYYGRLANLLRTKYRDVDLPLTENGVDQAYRHGVHAVVHGHRNNTDGQRIMLRKGMIHFEGDVTLDRNSRRKEGLTGHGMGVTIIHPQGHVMGVSNDHPHAKVFKPEHFFD